MKSFLALLFAALISTTSLPVFASDTEALIARLQAARESLFTMIISKRDEEQQRLVKQTADDVSAHLAKMTVPSGKEADFAVLVETWREFKKTREEELVPAILSGDYMAAKNIFGGIQKERAQKIMRIAKNLDK